MRIYFKKFLGLTATFFLVWLLIVVSKLFGFDFSLDLTLFSSWIALLIFFDIVVEGYKNRKIIYQRLKSYFHEKKEQHHAKINYVQNKIISAFPLFSGQTGKIMALVLADIYTTGIGTVSFLKKTIFSKYILMLFCLFGILFDIVVITSSVDLVVLTLTGAWALAVRLFKFSGKISVGAALLFLVLSPLFLLLKKDLLAEKTAVWAYMFLLVGTIQMLLENRKEIFGKSEA